MIEGSVLFYSKVDNIRFLRSVNDDFTLKINKRRIFKQKLTFSKMVLDQK